VVAMAQKKPTAGTPRRRPAPAKGSEKAAKTEKTMKEEAVPEPEEATVETHARSLPVLVPEVHVRRLPLPAIGVRHVPVPHVPDAVRSRLPEPTTNRVVWYGGLAGLAALGVIDWPVAGVVAAGTYVATRRAKSAMEEELAAR
jgi:hypothetical protein